MISDSHPTNNSANAADVFAGGGEMGELMRSLDWSVSALGAVETWSQSLKTAIQIILGSRYPMFIWWGEEMINFYNDAYIPILGRRHPHALGQSASDIWVEVWHWLGCQAKDVLEEGKPSWNESLLEIMERNGYLEETYFTFSYSPISQEGGGVGGIFCACTEDTRRVLDDRRLRTLRELGAQTAQAKTLGEACQMATNVLGDNPHDIPFALIYQLNAKRQNAHLIGTVNLARDTLASPTIIDLTAASEMSDRWLLNSVLTSGESQVIDDLIERFGQLPGGAWAQSPTRAIVLPLNRPGQETLGVLIIGISPLRPLDEDYRGFFDLVAGQVTTAIANTLADEEEHQRAEALAELDRAKTTFFNNISHEFRTPLTLILSPAADALADGDHPLPPQQWQRLDVIQRNSLRLLKLVNTLLDVSRLECDRTQAVYEPTDLATFTAELASVFRAAIEAANLRLIVDCPPLPEPVYVDREMWEKVVLNLLSNAFKFTFEGEITVSLQGQATTARLRETGELQASTLAVDGLTSELESSPSELEVSLSELKVSHSEPKHSHSKPENSHSEPKHSHSEPEVFHSEPEDSHSEPEDSHSEPEVFHSEPEDSHSEPKRSPSEPGLETLHATSLHFQGQYGTSVHSTINKHLVLEVRDTGIGIPAAELPHLFKRFHQVKGAKGRSLEGSGIGLSLVQELVKLHGGTIQVNSIPGEGSCFQVFIPTGCAHLPPEQIGAPQTLPSTVTKAAAYVSQAWRWLPETGNISSWVEDSQLDTDKTEGTRQKAQGNNDDLGRHDITPTPSTPARILLVDDNADMCDYVRRLLSQRWQVETAANSAIALNRIQQHSPDLVLSDVIMPELDRFQLIQSLRSNPHTENIPIILLSARAGEEATIGGLAAGADDYLIKPFSARELIARVETHLKLAQRRQEQSANRFKDEFLMTVTHELQAPLATILGWTRLLQSKPCHPTLTVRALAAIERNATIEANLVNDLLDISTLVSGKFHLSPQNLNLIPLIQGVITTLHPTAEVKSIQLIQKISDTTPVIVFGDSDRLKQMITNLLSNALKFTPAGGQVEVKLEHHLVSGSNAELKGFAQITITDTGMGISAEFLPQVFQRFRQAEVPSRHSPGGVGIGLAIADHLVKLHHGTIEVNSEGEGQGTTFIVKLPLVSTSGEMGL